MQIELSRCFGEPYFRILGEDLDRVTNLLSSRPGSTGEDQVAVSVMMVAMSDCQS